MIEKNIHRHVKGDDDEHEAFQFKSTTSPAGITGQYGIYQGSNDSKTTAKDIPHKHKPLSGNIIKSEEEKIEDISPPSSKSDQNASSNQPSTPSNETAAITKANITSNFLNLLLKRKLSLKPAAPFSSTGQTKVQIKSSKEKTKKEIEVEKRKFSLWEEFKAHLKEYNIITVKNPLIICETDPTPGGFDNCKTEEERRKNEASDPASSSLTMDEFDSSIEINKLLGRGKFAAVYSAMFSVKSSSRANAISTDSSVTAPLNNNGDAACAMKIAQYVFKSRIYIDDQLDLTNNSNSERDNPPPIAIIHEFNREVRTLVHLQRHYQQVTSREDGGGDFNGRSHPNIVQLLAVALKVCISTTPFRKYGIIIHIYISLNI
jgi:hypothetical protein